MHRPSSSLRLPLTGAIALMAGLAVLLLFVCAGASAAAPLGKVQGKVIAADSGEPIGFADVLLIPADTTMRKVGGLTNADGTFLLEAAAGRYAIQVRALSYQRKRIEGVVLEPGALLPFETGLQSDAIEQEEIVVEAKARQNTEASMLVARKKATSLGDAVSAEQVRRSPDKDAGEVLRRVTGLSVSDGKYVFVRGLGERYSSTEVDGVRIASPEQNKRVVPLDLLPANLLENIVVQKTYTADRPGEFGGGDVQVKTKDFPGGRTWSFSVSQGQLEGSTFRDRLTYSSSRADLFGFGADSRGIPDAIRQVAGDRPLFLSNDPTRGFTKATLAELGKSFANVWSTRSERTLPNGSYSLTYGDEFKLFGRPLGLIESWSLSRSFSQRDESQRFYSDLSDTLYDYAVQRDKESVQLGGVSGLSYRLSPRHSLHLRGLYTNGADDEVRTYEGQDHNRTEATTGEFLVHRGTRFLYTQRSVLSGALEGRHEFARLLGATLDWKLNRSRAKRVQPDRRETIYDRNYYYDGNGDLVGYWGLGSAGSREYGDLEDNGRGLNLSASVPYRLAGLGAGKVAAGYDRQTKERSNFYRRFNLLPNQIADPSQSPDSLFSPGAFDGSQYSAYVLEGTLDIDNYAADQRVTAAYVSVDVPLGRRARGNIGIRHERGLQEVRTFDLFKPGAIVQEGRLDNTDWLPSANLTLEVARSVNVRLATSRTLARPDLNELSPSPSLEYVGGFRVAGNPDLVRSRIDNYDLRVEAFPSASDVFAAGLFYKSLHQPIEQVIQGGAPPILVPRNSDKGHNVGVELEARTGLGRLWSGLERFALNANGSFIRSEVRLTPQLSQLGSATHPLQGQADYLFNAALSYSAPSGKLDVGLLVGTTGKRLRTLGLLPLPDVYEQPSRNFDATLNWVPLARTRLKLAAKNLFNPRIQELQGGKEVSGYRAGRSYSIALSYGS